MVKHKVSGLVGAALCTLAFNTNAAKVEIVLADKLDGVTSEYCIDVAGGGKNIKIEKGLQSHTCYSYRGDLGKDQTFDTERFADNVLYMTEVDVCAQLGSLEEGAAVGLAECDDSDLQALAFTEDGTISPVKAPEMCLTAGEDTRFGRSKKHQIKTLTLEKCSEDNAKYQIWRTRETADEVTADEKKAS